MSRTTAPDSPPFVEPGVYEHYEGGRYLVYGVRYDAPTAANGRWSVDHTSDGMPLGLDIEEFFASVEVSPETFVPRFRRVGDLPEETLKVTGLVSDYERRAVTVRLADGRRVTFTREFLSHLLASTHPPMRKCPTCGGDGEVGVEPIPGLTCGTCDGTGEVPA